MREKDSAGVGEEDNGMMSMGKDPKSRGGAASVLRQRIERGAAGRRL